MRMVFVLIGGAVTDGLRAPAGQLEFLGRVLG